MSTIRVTMNDVRAACLCSGGARAFFTRHGLDWAEFLRAGLPVEVIEATSDAMALKAAQHARERHQDASHG